MFLILKKSKIWLLLTALFTGPFCSGLLAQLRPDSPAQHTTETMHLLHVHGKEITYQAITGYLPAINEKGAAVGKVFYTYYKRAHITQYSSRPLIFAFNGGTGSSSVWLHLGYFGPRIVKTDQDGYGIQPAGVENNDLSILDIADLVYVDPLQTGFSRIDTMPSYSPISNSPEFFSQNGDIRYLASWVEQFLISHNNRWLSPKYLIGESYGAIRVAGLANQLQRQHKIYISMGWC